jgi:hypothetical protein
MTIDRFRNVSENNSWSYTFSEATYTYIISRRQATLPPIDTIRHRLERMFGIRLQHPAVQTNLGDKTPFKGFFSPTRPLRVSPLVRRIVSSPHPKFKTLTPFVVLSPATSASSLSRHRGRSAASIFLRRDRARSANTALEVEENPAKGVNTPSLKQQSFHVTEAAVLRRCLRPQLALRVNPDDISVQGCL